MKRAVLALTIILALFVSLMVSVQSVKSVSKTIVIPDDYLQIQEAINAANDGDTIFVRKGTYEEQTLTINKTINLMGEGPTSTIVNLHPPWIFTGSFHFGESGAEPDYGWDYSIKMESNYAKISGLTINSSEGNVLVSGIGNTMAGNNITTQLLLKENAQNITGNTVKGTIICSGENHTIADNSLVHLFVSASGIMIRNNTISGGNGGIQMGSYGNTIFNNTIVNCGGALFFWMSAAANLIYGNNFVNSSVYQVKIEETVDPSMGRWDNGVFGNYWSDYLTRYPDASELGGSGIGNTAYVIDEYNKDNYPLMEPYGLSSIPTPKDELTSLVTASVIVVAVVVVALGLLLLYRIKRK
jgi:parallel beta-helix repeat protein